MSYLSQDDYVFQLDRVSSTYTTSYMSLLYKKHEQHPSYVGYHAHIMHLITQQAVEEFS